MILRTLFKIILSLLTLGHLAYGQSYHISFTQNGEVVKIENSVVRLKKEPFVIQVTLDSLDGVFVHCSESPIVSYKAQKNRFPDFQQVGNKAGVESEFNVDQELFLQDNDRFSYWFYDPQHYDWHRFDANVYVSGSQVKATKTVRQFFDLILNEPRSLQAINEPIYLAFFSVTGSFKDKTAKLAQVETYQLIFED
jgi:hypothetical protein